MFVADGHAEIEATWKIYQRVITAYREPDGSQGKQLMQALIDAVTAGVPEALTEVIPLGRTLKRRAGDILAYFDRPGTSNGPAEALELGHCLRLPAEGPCECELMLSCPKFLTTSEYAPETPGTAGARGRARQRRADSRVAARNRTSPGNTAPHQGPSQQTR
ncbi:hypothetical protein ABIB51_001994 [Arthrobacter sp. UYCu712]